MGERTDFRRELGQQLRVDSVRASAAAGSGHPTSSMSAADLMAVLVDGHLRIDPSAISESPHRHQTRYGSRSSRAAASATPAAIGRPWPSEPVATSVGGMRGVGWPSSREPSLRNVSSSASSILPVALSVE